MKNELAVVDQGTMPLTARDIRANVNLIQEVMGAVMKKGTHYGTIPGCGEKPALFKPGAEKILSTFRIAVTPEVEDLSNPDCAHYRVRAVGTTAGGVHVGTGIGECSSDEEKYKWRKAVCADEFKETDASRKREVWKKDFKSGKMVKIQQVRMNCADIANTVLKMAKKRALVDMTLTATAASDVFTQDIEDLPPEYLNQNQAAAPTQANTIRQPQRKAPPAATQQRTPNTEALQGEQAQANVADNDGAPEPGSFDGDGSALDDLQITKIGQAKGKTDKGPWCCTFVTCSDGKTYSTFEEAVADFAQKAFDEKRGVLITAAEGKTNKKGEVYYPIMQIS